MEPLPSPIPVKLLELLQDMQIDWTSAAWRDMFKFFKIIAGEIWGRSWKEKLIICHCDNQ